MSNQMTLWNAESLGIADRLKSVVVVKQHRNDDEELVSEVLRCLPMSSKDNPSIGSVTGLKGEMLKARTRECTDDLKKALVHQAVAIGNDTHFTGVSMRISRTGRVTLGFKRVAGMSIESCTEEELLKRLEEIRKSKQVQGNGQTEAPEPPATTNGKGKGKGKTAAAVAAK